MIIHNTERDDYILKENVTHNLHDNVVQYINDALKYDAEISGICRVKGIVHMGTF